MEKIRNLIGVVCLVALVSSLSLQIAFAEEAPAAPAVTEEDQSTATNTEGASTESTGTESPTTPDTELSQPSTESTAVSESVSTEVTTPDSSSTEDAASTSGDTSSTETPAQPTTTTATTAAPTTTETQVNAPSKPAKQLKKLSVTGSHIKRVDIEGPSPILSLDRQQIEMTGASNLSELLRKLPLNTGESYNEFQTQSTTPGSSGINLRGLGQDATLVLLNGRRVANYSFAFATTDTFVDLNSIPIGAIERIDIQKDGASAIYGSDALAGVVNIILRSDYDNSEISLGHGKSAEGDADEQHINFITGISNDTGNMTFIFDYFKRQPFLLGDRDFSESAFQDGAYDPNGAGVDWTSFDNHPANGYDIAGTLPVDPFCAGFTFCSGFFDPNPYITAIPKTERTSGLITMNREINANVDFFSEFMANKTITEYQSAPTAMWGDLDGVVFPGGHPANPYPGSDLILYWRMTDAGPRRDVVETNAQRFVTGFEGSTNNFDWQFDINLNRSTSVLNGENYINRLALIDAFNNGLLDPFGTSNADDINNVKASISRKGVSELFAMQGKINTEIGELEGGPVALAVGVERRWESLTDTPDSLTEQGQVIGQSSTRSSGDRYLNSGFAEVSMPVLDNVEVQLATRIENYSDFGNSYNPKLAVRYQPNSNVVLRASWGTGFRAPSLPELHQAQTSLFENVVDTTRCAAVGLGCSPAQVPVNFSGNDGLKPEESEAIYLGAVIEPVNNFSIGVDYWRYEQTDVIDANTQFIVDNPNLYGYRVFRGAPTVGGDPGPILSINDSYINVGEQNTDGIDLSVKYQWKVAAAGTFHIQSMITRILSFDRKAYPGAPTEDKLGTYHFPELRGNLTFGWERTVVAASITANYIDGYEDEFYGIDFYGDGPADSNRDFHMIDSYKSYDAQISYTGIADSKLTFGIKNLTDEDPPLSNASNVGYDSATHDPTGRFYYARYNHQF